MTAGVRVCPIALVVVAVWLLSAAFDEPHRALPISADVAQFASGRAELVLARLLGPERPHPVSSEENAAVRARILEELSRLGIAARPYHAFACVPRHGFVLITCATVDDIVAQVLPGQGKAVLMMAHYDSVPAGPGASDNMSGVAAILETARALRVAGIEPVHPVMALITDGEEAGLVGAYAFLQNDELRARVAAVVNVDARGTRGPSLLFQTSPGDASLISLYLAHVPAPDTSSLYAEIYRHLPNDTDLTPFLQAGIPSFNFAFIENLKYYHSPLDLQRNLNAASLQMQGDNLLGVVSALAQTPYSALSAGNDVYLSLFNRLVPRLPVASALPLSVVAWLMIIVAAALGLRGVTGGALARGLLLPPLLIGSCIVAGFLVELVASLVAGAPDPSYAHPLALRLALVFAVWTLALIFSRWIVGGVAAATAGAWLWMATLAIVSAALLPGLCPYFLFPSLIAAVAMLATARAPGAWAGIYGQAALCVAALASLVVWIGLMVGGEAVMGLRLHPLFTVPAAFALTTLCPFLGAQAEPRRALDQSAAASAAVACVLTVVSGLLPTFSAAAPQRLNLVYLQDRRGARWLADPSPLGRPLSPLPSSLAHAARFKLDHAPDPLLGEDRLYIAPADTAVFASAGDASSFALPRATVSAAPRAAGEPPTAQATLVHWQGSSAAARMVLYIPPTTGVRSIELSGQRVAFPSNWKGATWLQCASRDCREQSLVLSWDGRQAQLQLAEERYGLPAFAATLQRARPDTAMPSQDGDQTMLIEDLSLPRRSSSSTDTPPGQ